MSMSKILKDQLMNEGFLAAVGDAETDKNASFSVLWPKLLHFWRSWEMWVAYGPHVGKMTQWKQVILWPFNKKERGGGGKKKCGSCVVAHRISHSWRTRKKMYILCTALCVTRSGCKWCWSTCVCKIFFYRIALLSRKQKWHHYLFKICLGLGFSP